MRKILLATTALVGVALTGAAHAAPSSPIALNVGGYTDFVAGGYHESQGTVAGTQRAHRDFEVEGKLNIDAVGKAANGLQYGANLGLWNGSEGYAAWNNTTPATININSAYVWLSSAFGKVTFGDSHGATDLFVYAPTVGEGQIDGRYTDFTDATTLSHVQPTGIDNTEHSTNITYYTPRVGNDTHKVQLGVSYLPNYNSAGQGVVLYNKAGSNPYQDVIKGAAQAFGEENRRPRAADVIRGAAGGNAKLGAGSGEFLYAPLDSNGDAVFKSFTSYGVGAQATCSGVTVGGSYVNKGRFGTVGGQNKNQDVYSFGAKYEFDKVAVAANYLTASTYDNLLAGTYSGRTPVYGQNYVRNFDAYGAGATYTWVPGLTTNLDGVLFSQKVDRTGSSDEAHNQGYVVLVSEKLTF